MKKAAVVVIDDDDDDEEERLPTREELKLRASFSPAGVRVDGRIRVSPLGASLFPLVEFDANRSHSIEHRRAKRVRTRLSSLALVELSARRLQSYNDPACEVVRAAMPYSLTGDRTVDPRAALEALGLCIAYGKDQQSPNNPYLSTVDRATLASIVAQFRADLSANDNNNTDAYRPIIDSIDSSITVLSRENFLRLLSTDTCLGDAEVSNYVLLLDHLYGSGSDYEGAAPTFFFPESIIDPAMVNLQNERSQQANEFRTSRQEGRRLWHWSKSTVTEGGPPRGTLHMLLHMRIGGQTDHWVVVSLEPEEGTADRFVVHYRDSFIIGDLNEYVARFGALFVLLKIDASKLRHVLDRSIPQQEDSTSCGLFALWVMRALALRIDLSRQQPGAPQHLRELFAMELLRFRVPIYV